MCVSWEQATMQVEFSLEGVNISFWRKTHLPAAAWVLAICAPCCKVTSVIDEVGFEVQQCLPFSHTALRHGSIAQAAAEQEAEHNCNSASPLHCCSNPSPTSSKVPKGEPASTPGWEKMSTFWAPHARTLQLRLQISSGDRTKEFHVIPDLLTQNPTSYCSMTISFQNHPATQKKSVRLNANRRPIQLVAPKRGNPAPTLTHLIRENMSTYNCKRESKPP